MIPYIVVVVIVVFIIFFASRNKKGDEGSIQLVDEGQEAQVETGQEQVPQKDIPKTAWYNSQFWEKTWKKIQEYWKPLLALVLAHALLAFISPSLWWQLAKQPVFWVDHVVGAVLILFFREEDKDRKGVVTGQKLSSAGSLVLTLLIAANVAAVVSAWWKAASTEAAKGPPKEAALAWQVVTATPLPDRHSDPAKTDTEKKVRQFFRDKKNGLSESRSNLMIDICGAESDFHQFEEDGKTVYRRRPTPDNPETDDVGVCQIHEPTWLAKSKSEDFGPEYDINTLNGNLKMALWIYQNDSRGPQNWTVYQNSTPSRTTKLTRIIKAPVGSWGERVGITGLKCSGKPSGEVYVRDENGIYQMGPDRIPSGIKTHWSQYMSASGKEETIVKTCEHIVG